MDRYLNEKSDSKYVFSLTSRRIDVARCDLVHDVEIVPHLRKLLKASENLVENMSYGEMLVQLLTCIAIYRR